MVPHFNIGANVGKVAAGLKDGSIVAGKDSRGKTAFVTASKTEASKATATGVAKYGSGFATGFESESKSYK